MKSIVVFCGSGIGTDPRFLEIAKETGRFLANKKITVIYGGAKVGLMGAVADGALERNGKVIGIIPHFLSSKEIVHENLTELIMVKTMHERKLLMHELSQGVIALPGGFGTMEELFEMLTWAQLGLHQKPIGILNFLQYYDSLLNLSDTMAEQGFLKPSYRKMLVDASTLEELFDKLVNYKSIPSEILLTAQNT